MSKLIVAALAGAAVIAYQNPAQAQEVKPPADAPSALAPAQSGQKLPPVVVQQKKPAADAPAAKPAPKKPVVEADDTPPPRPKKVASKPKPKPAPAVSAPAPQPPGSEAASETATSAAPATALGTYNPALDLPGLKLPPGTTITTAGPVQGYRALSAMSATKTATPIEQIPQSIQVVPKSVIDDQRNLTVTEALQNVSSVQGVNDLGIGNTDLQPLRIRGFRAEQWLDGLVVHYDAGDRDAFANVERIEVLKGPSAILYGGGSGAPVGGAVNIVSKLPTDRAGGEFGVTFGSHAYARPYFDVNQPLSANGNVLFRITGEYTSADSFVDVLHSDRYSINPTLTFTDKTNTTLTIQGRVSRFTQQAYAGLPAVGTVAGNFRIDPDMYIGPANIPRSYTEVAGMTVTLDHKFDSVWSFNVKGRWTQSSFDQKSQSTISAAPDVFPPSTWSLLNTDLKQEQEEITINPNLQARFSVGPTKNTWLVGGDYSRVTDRGHMFSDFGVFPVDLLSPIFLTPYTDPNPASPFYFPFFDFNSVYTTMGAYTQLQSTIHDRLHILAGVRLASIDIEYFEKVPFGGGGFFPPQTFVSEKTKALPRVGAVFDLVPGLSVYGSYSEGMRATGFTQAFNVAPEESSQIEGGFKFNLGNQLTGTLSVYDIRRSNVPVILGVGVGALSEQNSRGFEADVVWQPSRNWKVLASYGFTNAQFADSLTGIPKGNKVTGVPEHSGRVWVNYAFDHPMLRGWSAGAGVYLASEQFVDTANLYRTPSYFTVDAKIAYETEHYKAAFHVKNLTGEKYFTPYDWFGGQVAPGADRAFYGTLAYKY